jgi:hypothetical protein
MASHPHRPQKSEQIDLDDTKPVVVRPLPQVDDRLHNPKDLEVDAAAMREGVEHGGTLETHAAARAARGAGGRKRSGPASRYRSGRDISKRR